MRDAPLNLLSWRCAAESETQSENEITGIYFSFRDGG